MTARVLEALRTLVREIMAPTAYHVPVRYRVVLASVGDRLELQIVRKGSGFPDTLPLSMQPGAPGAKGTPALGSMVLVQFIEGDPSLPVVTHFARPDETGFVPTAASLDASGTVRVGESADLVELGSGTETPPPVDPTGRVLRYGDTITTPGGDLVLAPGSIPAGVARVSA